MSEKETSGGVAPGRATAESTAAGTAAGTHGQILPRDPVALELLISQRRDRLAATVDELVRRAQPREIARRGALGAVSRFRSATCTPDGQLRVERVGAAVAAVVTLVVLVLWRRRRSG
jgi:hypothetical protein